MSKLLLTDPLEFTVRYKDEAVVYEGFYDNYIKDILEYVAERLNIAPTDLATLKLYRENGERLPKALRVYDHVELITGATLELR